MCEIMVGTCEICGKTNVPLERTYFRYPVKCECHSPSHFEIVNHCKECKPKEPAYTKISIRTDLLKKMEPEITGNTSDGYHTFNELYHHRAVLFSVICNSYKQLAWKSKKHHDGTMYEGMFIVGIETPFGQATYHYDVSPYWDMFEVKEMEKAPMWDGHTPSDAIERIAKLGEISSIVYGIKNIKHLLKMEVINMKFRKKPVEIEAVQFRSDNFNAVMDFCPIAKKVLFDEEKGQYYLTIPTLEGEMRASEGDYIIKGVIGEFYPCKPDIFMQTYEPVEGSTKGMMFKQAYEALKQGAKIKRPHWRGFWVKENGTITMHCKDGSVIPFLETEDIFVDLDNIVADDWEVMQGSEVKDLNITTFTFGEAISNLKRGNKVARKGWNGKGMFVVFQKGYPQGINCNKQTAEAWGLNEGDLFRCEPYLQIKMANGSHAMWVPSINDCLSEDWYVIESNGAQK